MPDDNTALKDTQEGNQEKEVTERRNHTSAVIELAKQLATLSTNVPDPSDAPCTGEKTVQHFQRPPSDNWNKHGTVQFSYETADRKRSYIGNIYQSKGTKEHAIVLEPTYGALLDLYEEKDWDGLADALVVADEWREKITEWFKTENNFKQALEYMEKREARGDPIYTKVREIFSQLRDIESTESAAGEGDQEMIATIILDCHEGTDDQFNVHFWSLKRSRKTPTDPFIANEVFRDGGLDPKKSELVYSTALSFYKEEYWAGLRNLFDIDQTWWDSILRDLLCHEQFERVLNYLKGKEENKKVIYPQFNNIFSWTRVPECKPEDVKVIIAGHDPLPDPRATGISFLIEDDRPGACKSVDNVFYSVARNFDYALGSVKHRCPYSWCKQGVLLLNAYMTIGSGKDHKHRDCGWEVITNKILKHFVNQSQYILLWGADWTTRRGGNDSPIQCLTEMVIDDQTQVIPNAHPGYRGQFYQETAVDERFFYNLRHIIHWDTITNGYPEIPSGVIHPNLSSLEQQMAALDLGTE